MFRSLLVLLLSTVAFGQTHRFPVDHIELVPGLKDRIELKQPAATRAAGHTLPVLVQRPPCSIPILTMEIPKDVKFHLRQKHPPAQALAGMPHARVAEVCPDR